MQRSAGGRRKGGSDAGLAVFQSAPGIHATIQSCRASRSHALCSSLRLVRLGALDANAQRERMAVLRAYPPTSCRRALYPTLCRPLSPTTTAPLCPLCVGGQSLPTAAGVCGAWLLQSAVRDWVHRVHRIPRGECVQRRPSVSRSDCAPPLASVVHSAVEVGESRWSCHSCVSQGLRAHRYRALRKSRANMDSHRRPAPPRCSLHQPISST